MLSFLLHSLVGLLLLTAVTFGGVVVIARALYNSTLPPKRFNKETCECQACTDWRNARATVRAQARPAKSWWYSTAELREGMQVYSKDSGLWFVKSITPRTYAVMVELQHSQDPKRKSWRRISLDKVNTKMWWVRRGDGRGDR